MTDGHEAQAKAELAQRHQSRLGRFLRELIGWPLASRRMRSIHSVSQIHKVGPSHLHARPHDGDEPPGH